MTDTDTTTEETPGTDEGDDKGSPKALRDALKREKERNAKLTEQAMKSSFAEVGLDPTKGLGKAIARDYDGDLTAEAVLEYAKTEYEYEQKPGDHPKQKIIDNEQKKLDDANSQSTSQVSQSLDEQLAAARADGNSLLAGNIKAQQLREKMKS